VVEGVKIFQSKFPFRGWLKCAAFAVFYYFNNENLRILLPAAAIIYVWTSADSPGWLIQCRMQLHACAYAVRLGPSGGCARLPVCRQGGGGSGPVERLCGHASASVRLRSFSKTTAFFFQNDCVRFPPR
jgi:hypothetical protein